MLSTLSIITNSKLAIGAEFKGDFRVVGLPRSEIQACGECTFREKRDTVRSIRFTLFPGVDLATYAYPKLPAMHLPG